MVACTLYMGWDTVFNPVWLILPRKTALRSAKSPVFSRKRPWEQAPPTAGKGSPNGSEPFVRHLVQIAAVEIGHQDAV
jgi:hypothetical protein